MTTPPANSPAKSDVEREQLDTDLYPGAQSKLRSTTAWVVGGVVALVVTLVVYGFASLRITGAKNSLDSAQEALNASASSYDVARNELATMEYQLAQDQYDLDYETRYGSPGDGEREEALRNVIQDDIALRDEASLVLRLALERNEQAVGEVNDARRDLRSAESQLLPYTLIAFIMTCGAILLAVLAVHERGRDRAIRRNIAVLASEEPNGDAWSWARNASRLHKYHEIVQTHAESSRLLTRVVLMAGFGFLVIVGIIAATTQTAAAAAATSIVAASGAALGTFVSKSVLANYETSSRELSVLVLHPVEVERFLRAEQLLERLGESQRQEALIQLIDRLTSNRLTLPSVGEAGSS